MPIPSYSRSGPRISEAIVEEFEMVANVELPADYRLFLLTINGGAPSLDTFRISGNRKSLLQYLFHLGDEQSYYNLKKRFLNHKEEIPLGYVCIGIDLGGNLVCLSIDKGESTYGAVYFWDHDINSLLADRSDTVVQIAENFAAFNESLFGNRYDVEFDEIERLGKSGLPEEVKEYLSSGGTLVDRNQYGRSIVQEAVRYNNRPVLSFCLEQHADLSGTLHLAAITKNADLIKFLLAHRVDVNERDKNGKTALAVALGAEAKAILKEAGGTL